MSAESLPDLRAVEVVEAEEVARRNRWFARAVKRGIDLVGSALLLAVLSVLLLGVALVVRLTSPGPALFLQRRVGLDGRTFRMIKFRTMVANAEDLLAEGAVISESKNVLLFKIKYDPRITRIGRVLRRYSIDELPQLWNVLRGEMSLVGPRPALPCEVAKYTSHEARRLTVKPGMTGLWQISGRSDLDWAASIECDLRYVDQWGLRMDTRILFRTMSVVLGAKGAY